MNPGKSRAVPWRLLAAAHLSLVIGIIVLADRQGPSALAWVYYVPAGDKIGHFVLMGGLAFLLNQCLSHRLVRCFGISILLGSILVMLAAMLEEFSQAFIPNRTFDLIDLASDAFGIWFAGRVSHWWTASLSKATHASHPERH